MINPMNQKQVKVQLIGFTFVGVVVAISAVVFSIFITQLSENALMGASPKYKPHFPAVPATDITHAQQCNPDYPSKWIGCYKQE